jgi:cellulose synthase/poly-beta-1,6-N-acetylglucosamine synthase-like glycosyltransferase
MSPVLVPVEIGLMVITGALFVPSLVFFLECIAALLPEPTPVAGSGSEPRAVIVVPAHNEAAGIGATLAVLQGARGERQSILVVADNCHDETAARVRAVGVPVVERHDPERAGKGYAIAYGLEHLAANPPEVVVLLDADCRISGPSLRALAQRALETGRPVQADYVLAPPERPTPMSVVSGLAVLVKNKVRPAGLRKLGLPCQLTGSGMAFLWEVIRKAPPAGSNLVEDMLIGVELAQLGHPPLSCSEAEVASELPERDEAAERQRRRWEHGHLDTLLNQVPPLLWKGARARRLDLLAMGLDLMVPPMALLVLMLLATTAVALLARLLGASIVPLAIAGASLTLVVVAVAIAWLRFGRRTLPLRYLVFIPAYVLWKIPLYLAFFARRKQQKWERTERS